jgi:hypothetical protein
VIDKWLKDNFLRPLLFNGTSENKTKLKMNNEISSDKNILIDKDSSGFDYSSFNKIMKICLSLFVVSNLLMIAGVIWAKFLVEFPNSNFFNKFQNCLDLKEMYNSEFSSKIVRDGGLFNVFFGMILACYLNHHKYKNSINRTTNKVSSFKNPFQGLQIIYDKNCKFILMRICVIILCMTPMVVVFIISSFVDGVSAVVLNIIFGLSIPFLLGFLLGTFYFFLLNLCKVPYYQKHKYEFMEKKMETSRI